MQIRPSVEFCSVEMEKKLRQNDHKNPWENLNIWHLFDRTKEELGELEVAIAVYQVEPTLENINAVISECADVCNFAHMIMGKVCETMCGLERGRPKK